MQCKANEKVPFINKNDWIAIMRKLVFYLARFEISALIFGNKCSTNVVQNIDPLVYRGVDLYRITAGVESFPGAFPLVPCL